MLCTRKKLGRAIARDDDEAGMRNDGCDLLAIRKGAKREAGVVDNQGRHLYPGQDRGQINISHGCKECLVGLRRRAPLKRRSKISCVFGIGEVRHEVACH